MHGSTWPGSRRLRTPSLASNACHAIPSEEGRHRDRAQHCRPTAHLPGTDPTERSAATFPPPAATEWRNADTLFRTDEHASDMPGRAAAQARAPADGGRHHGAGRHRSSRLPDHDDVAGQRGGGRAGPGRRQLPGESPAGIAGEGVLHALAVRGLRVPVGRRHEPEGVSVPVGGAVMGLPAEGSRYVLPGRTDSTQGHLSGSRHCLRGRGRGRRLFVRSERLHDDRGDEHHRLRDVQSLWGLRAGPCGERCLRHGPNHQRMPPAACTWATRPQRTGLRQTGPHLNRPTRDHLEPVEPRHAGRDLGSLPRTAAGAAARSGSPTSTEND